MQAFSNLSRADRRRLILEMERENKQHPEALAEVPSPIPRHGMTAPVRAWRSQEFLVQQFVEGEHIRLSVNRTHVDPATMAWVDGITWDELQRLKREAGYGSWLAVEVYPPDSAVVNVANIRHLWILPVGTHMPFTWNVP